MTFVFVILALFADDQLGFKSALEKAEQIQVTQFKNGERIELRGDEAKQLAKLVEYAREQPDWLPEAPPGAKISGWPPPYMEMTVSSGGDSRKFFLWRTGVATPSLSISREPKPLQLALKDLRLWNALLDRFEGDIDRDTLKTWPIFERSNFTGFDQFEAAKAIIWSHGDLLVADEKADAILIYDATTNPLRPKLRQRLVHPSLAIPRLLASCEDRVLVVGKHLVELKKVDYSWSVTHRCEHPELIDATTCFASPSGKAIFASAFPERRLLKFSRSPESIRFVSLEADAAIGDAAFSKDGKTAYFVSEDLQKQTSTLRIADYNEPLLTFTTLKEKVIDNKPFLRRMVTPHLPPKRLLTGNVKVIGDHVYTVFSSGKVSAWKLDSGDLIEEKVWRATFGGASPFWGASIAAVGENQRLWLTFEGSENVVWFNSTHQPGGMGFGGSYRDVWRHFSTIEGLTVSRDGRFCYFVNRNDLVVLGGEVDDLIKPNRPLTSGDTGGEYWQYFWLFRGDREHAAREPTPEEWREILKEKKANERDEVGK